jgi:hypothetical protein
VNDDTRTRRHSWIQRVTGTLFIAALFLGPSSPALTASSVGAASLASSSSTLTESLSAVPSGASIIFSYSTPAATVSSANWIGIYAARQIPGQVGSTTWQYAPGSGGSLTFSTTSLNGVGSYVAYYLYNDCYQVLAGPADFTVTASTPAPAPVFVRDVGATGRGALTDPFGVAVNGHGNVWVADRSSSRVEEFAPSGALVTTFGDHGAGALLQPGGAPAPGWTAAPGGTGVPGGAWWRS